MNAIASANTERGMTLKGAYELAIAVLDDLPGSNVLAIGRFLPPSKVTDASPWGVSVQFAGGRKAVLWSPRDVAGMLSPSAPPIRTLPPPKSRSKKRPPAKKMAEPEPAAGWLFGGPV
ncbi:hypothetical protein [Rhodopirellula bahusiensis]|uniref:hypothetical protein n=1 Tax=Rhodopirellula bahusiensis TaxID=2014065 RepID=UPI003267A966